MYEQYASLNQFQKKNGQPIHIKRTPAQQSCKPVVTIVYCLKSLSANSKCNVYVSFSVSCLSQNVIVNIICKPYCRFYRV